MEFFQPWHMILLLFISGFYIVPFWQIFKKAGFPGALCLLMLLPVVNVILLYVVAFSKWNVVPAPVLGHSDLTR